MAFSVLIYVINMIYSLMNGPEAGDDPFNLNIKERESISPS
jgi:hypothetical protein